MFPAMFPDSLLTVIEKYNLNVEDISCSSAVLVISTKQGDEIKHHIGKWFYPSRGERFFTFQTETEEQDFIEEYFVLVMDKHMGVSALSLGILKYQNKCFDIFSFQDSIEVEGGFEFIDSPLGYLVEVASIENESSDIFDLNDARHIESKFTQRNRNSEHYYQTLHPSEKRVFDNFFVIKSRNTETVHPWNVTAEYTNEEMVSAKKQLDDRLSTQGNTENISVPLNDELLLECQRSCPQNNLQSCVLYDICAQSLSSASIPRTRLHVPWIIHRDGACQVMLKIVV